jgi:hypothetical protein
MVHGPTAQHQGLSRQIYEEMKNRIDPSKILGQKTYKQNYHFLSTNLKKPIFHKNFDVFFNKHLGIHLGNTLLINEMLYKNVFNESFNAIFLKSFDMPNKNPNDYFIFIILPYLEHFHHSRISALAFV